jgi:tRNA(Ile)-lysidine synthase
VARPDDPVLAAAGVFLDRFPSPVTLLVAISGGSDSTGLLLALVAALNSSRYPGFSILACTVDHALRSGSAEEALDVAALCRRYGVRHFIRRWDSPKPKTGIQAAARESRYRLLLEAAQEAGADAILAAHTADDQRETIAMRAERKAHGVGIAGMADAVLLGGRVWMLRPFLTLDRPVIRRFLTGLGESWVEDPSNANRAFERVRVREELVAGALPEDGSAASQRSVLAAAAADFIAMHVRVPSTAFAAVDAGGIAKALVDAGAWRGLMLLSAVMGGRVHGPDRASAARVRAFLESGMLSRLTAGRVVFDRRREGLFVYRECRGIESVFIEPGETLLWDGRFRISNHSRQAVIVATAGSRDFTHAGRDDAYDGVPQGVVGRAWRAMPAVAPGEGPADATILPVLAPYLHFLPRFDLPIANALAAVLGLARFPPPPNE